MAVTTLSHKALHLRFTIDACEGEPYEWVVQLSSRERNMLGQFSRDGRHLNVSWGGGYMLMAETKAPAFDFYDVVRIEQQEHLSAHPDLVSGAIIGRAYWADRSAWLYTVYFDQGIFDFVEESLARTGERVERSSIYDGATLRVSRSGEPVHSDDDGV